MPERLRDWIVNHDDSWIFIILYVGLAIVLSLWISLFWLVVVVAGHFVLEWIRQRHIREVGVLPEVFWELKLDIALVLFALVLTLYLDVVFGILGLQAAGRAGATIARAGARGGSRFAAWERTLRGLLLSADDAAQMARALVVRRPSTGRGAGAVAGAARAAMGALDGGQADVRHQQASGVPVDAPTAAARWGSWAGRWSKGDWFAVGLAVACVALILLAPWLTGHDYASAFATMGRELRPFPVTVPLTGAP